MTEAATWVAATISALEPLACPADADPMRAYLKDVAPFLGIRAPVRRAALREAWRGLPPLDERALAATARRLWSRTEREYAYAACDLIARQQAQLSAGFLVEPIEELLTDRPWWDTVDSLGTAAVSPIVARHRELVTAMWRWLDSGDRWLIRAAIQYQRGRGRDTDAGLLLSMCARFAGDREFFIAKAIGWALRDLASHQPQAVAAFDDAHPELSAVARREALRGLARTSRP